MCPHDHTPATLKESVHFSMFHWPQQYCKPLHIHSSRIPNRTTGKDCAAAASHPGPSPTALIPPSTPSPLPSPLTPKTLPCSSVWKSHVDCGPPAQVHLFCPDCFKGFCLHQQKSGGDNFLEFSLGLPLWRFAHSWLALSLTLSLRKGWYLRGLIYSEEFR